MARKAVLVVSHKGGTGKTLIAVNLALRLKEKGKRVGLIDSDIDSPNIPEFLPVEGELSVTGEKRLRPVDVDGMEVYSMALFAKDRAISMRGSEYAEILKDVVEHGEWAAEYFVVDLPAGAADTFKRIVSVFGDSLLGSVVVSQPAHVADTERVLKLHRSLGIPVIGLIENMSYFQCECKARHAVFGESTVDDIAERYGVDVLGKIPLSMEVRKRVERGNPLLIRRMGEPIRRAVDKILTLEPKRPGFLAAVREKLATLREKIVGVLANIVIVANREIDIPGLQDKYGFRGGRVIRLNAMDAAMEKVVVRADFRVQDGKLVLVKKPRKVDAEIDVRPKALRWAYEGVKKLPDGTEIPYDFRSAWLEGDVEVYGTGDTVRALDFFGGLWSELREAAKGKVERFIKLL